MTVGPTFVNVLVPSINHGDFLGSRENVPLENILVKDDLTAE